MPSAKPWAERIVTRHSGARQSPGRTPLGGVSTRLRPSSEERGPSHARWASHEEPEAIESVPRRPLPAAPPRAAADRPRRSGRRTGKSSRRRRLWEHREPVRYPRWIRPQALRQGARRNGNWPRGYGMASGRPANHAQRGGYAITRSGCWPANSTGQLTKKFDDDSRETCEEHLTHCDNWQSLPVEFVDRSVMMPTGKVYQLIGANDHLAA